MRESRDKETDNPNLRATVIVDSVSALRKELTEPFLPDELDNTQRERGLVGRRIRTDVLPGGTRRKKRT